MLNKFLQDNKANLYLTFRIIVGLLFAVHGAQKFGLFGGSSVFGGGNLLLMIAGIVELFGGLGILLGAYTKLSATLGGIVMLYATLFVHAKNVGSIGGLIGSGSPELPLLYLAAFLVLATLGPGTKWVLRK